MTKRYREDLEEVETEQEVDGVRPDGVPVAGRTTTG